MLTFLSREELLRRMSGNVSVSKSSVGKGKEARRGDKPEVA